MSPVGLPLVLLAIAGCQPAPGSGRDSGSSTVSGGPTGLPTSSGSTVTGDGLSGEVQSPHGPLGDRDLLLCNLVGCIVDESEQDGTFAVALEPGWTGALKTHSEHDADPRLAALLLPLTMPESGALDLGTLFVPELREGVPFGSPNTDPQTLAAGDGLTLTLNRGDLTASPGTWLYDLAAGRVPDAHLPSYPELGSETLVAVYALHPFGATSSTPIEVRLPVDLPAGSDVCFRTISDIDGTFSDPVPGTSDGTVATTTPGTGITRLSWLVVSKRP